MNENSLARVLLVDDEKEFVQTLAERLKTRGLSVSTAANGPKALAKLELLEFDVIIIDLSMPEMGGIDVLRHIKGLDLDSEVIILTGYGTINAGVEAMKEGAFDFLEKPIQISQLFEKVLEATRRRNVKHDERNRLDIKKITANSSW